VQQSYDELHFYRGLEHIMTTIRLANLYVEETKPWVLAKKSPSDPTLLAMLSLVFETLRVTSIMMWPVIPNLSQMILGKILNVKI
jgi:methionyl-tRNA synthetase